MHQIEIKLLQMPEVIADGKKISFPYKKAEALLYYLAAEGQASREQAAALLWEDADSESARKNLRHAIYMLKKTFGYEVIRSEQHFNLRICEDIVCITDIDQFDRQGITTAWNGEFLSGFFIKNSETYEEWLNHWRNYYKDLYLCRLYEEIKRIPIDEMGQLEERCSRYRLQDPYDERIALLLMKRYREKSMYLKAIEVYQSIYHLLEEEMGIVPGQELTKLYREIRLEWAESTEEKAEDKTYGELIHGRKQEAIILDDIYKDFLQGGRHAIHISGEYGAGKSYLVNYMSRGAEENGVLHFSIMCYFADQKKALQSWNTLVLTLGKYIREFEIQLPKSVLQAVAQIFPAFGEQELEVPLPIDLASSFNVRAAQNGLYRIMQSICAACPVLLEVDNIQYMDAYSRRLLLMMLQGIPGSLCVVMTSLGGVAQELRGFMDAVQDLGMLTDISLKPFSQKDIQEIIAAETGELLDADALQSVYQETRGNAYFLKEYLNARKSGKTFWGLNEKSGEWEERLHGISGNVRKFLDMISLFQNQAPLSILEIVSGADTLEILEAVEELKQRMLINEQMHQGEIFFGFCQEPFRNSVYAAISPIKRRVLHNSIGRALEKQLTSQNRDYYVPKIIEHYEKAENVPKVLEYEIRPFEEISISMFELYPTLLRPQQDGFVQDVGEYFKLLEDRLRAAKNTFSDEELYNELEARLLITVGRYEILMGRYGEGTKTVKKALETRFVQEHLAYKLKALREMIYFGIQVYRPDIMKENILEGLQLAADENLWIEQAIFRRLEGLYYTMTRQFSKAAMALGQSLDLFERYGEDEQGSILNEAAVYNYMGELARVQGQYAEAKHHYHYAINMCAEHNVAVSSTFYTNLGCCYEACGQREDAEKMFVRASQLYDDSFTLMGRSVAKSYCAMYAEEKGETEKAKAYIKEAMEAMRKLGSPSEKCIMRSIQMKLLDENPRAYELILPESMEFYRHDRECLQHEIEENVRAAKEKG